MGRCCERLGGKGNVVKMFTGAMHAAGNEGRDLASSRDDGI